MITGIDVGTSQRNLNWSLAASSGITVCYVKLGGDNSGRYEAPYYKQEVDAARGQGFIVGHYWVPGGDVLSAADYFVDHLRGDTSKDFFVLDNERLDSGRTYSDSEAAAWFRKVKDRLGLSPKRLFMYSGAADLRASTWPEVEALGVQLIVASYGANSGSRDHEPNLAGRFNNVWAGHQYTSQGNIGGVTIDLNLFQDWAFQYTSTGSISEEIDMAYERIRNAETGTIFVVDDWGGDHLLNYISSDITVEEAILSTDAAFGPSKDVTHRQFDVAVAFADRRWAQKRTEIASEVIKQLGTVSGVDTAAVVNAMVQAVPAALATVLAQSPLEISQQDITSIANATVSELHDRLGE